MSANGPLIRRLREDAGISVNELGRRANVNAGYLSRVERGKGDPTSRWVDAVATVLGVPTRALLLPDDDLSGDAA